MNKIHVVSGFLGHTTQITPQGITCYYSAARDIIQFYNQNESIEDHTILGLLNGLYIQYNKNSRFFGFDFEMLHVNNTLSENLTIFSCPANNKMKNIMQFIDDRIIKNEPIICFMNSKFLDYHSIYMNNNNQIHSIILYGVNKQENTCLISDSHIRVHSKKYDTYNGAFSLERLCNGVVCFWTFKNTRYDLSEENKLNVVIVSLRNYIHGANVDPISYGHQGLEDYLNEASNTIHNQDNYLEFCLKLNYDIKINGPCQLIIYILMITKRYLNEEITNECQALEIEWVTTANLILTSGYQQNISRGRSAIEKAKLNSRKQKDLFQKIVNKLETLI